MCWSLPAVRIPSRKSRKTKKAERRGSGWNKWKGWYDHRPKSIQTNTFRNWVQEKRDKKVTFLAKLDDQKTRKSFPTYPCLFKCNADVCERMRLQLSGHLTKQSLLSTKSGEKNRKRSVRAWVIAVRGLLPTVVGRTSTHFVFFEQMFHWGIKGWTWPLSI